MPLRILVTGSSGFIGSALVSTLAAFGHSVRAASRRPTATNHPNVAWAQLPDLESGVDWNSLVTGMDIVVHLAAIAHRRLGDSPNYERVNRIAIAELAQTCRRQNSKRLIFISSIGAQTGSAADHVVTELDHPRPVTAYDRAKLAAEEEIRRAGIPFTILRPVIVYGPGAKANIALIMRLAASPLPLPFAAFKNRRSLLAIDNLVQAVLFCLDGSATLNQTFIVCDPEPITLAEMLATLREAMGHSPRLVSIPAAVIRAIIIAAGQEQLWDRIGRDLVASSAKLRGVGWSPKFETKAGLRAIVKQLLEISRPS
jgi:nucleoside-diphosphate-sugar epimerase